MKLLHLALIVCGCLSHGLTIRAETFSEAKRDVLALGKLTAVPQWFEAEGMQSEGVLKPIYFEALPWKGKPTRAFAWLGIPQNNGKKLPGMVLVHGGGGTAFKEWVQIWNDQGFAAISIAVEGQIDQREEGNSKGWKRHAWAGPARDGIYDDSKEALKDQFMYHAVADTILANSLLRSFPEVNAEKVGLSGISWGGVITSTVIGIDNRFAFAIPIYGCGHLFDADNHWGAALGDNRLYQEVWDPMVRMKRAKMPVLWLSWPQDNHFPLDCLAASYNAASGPRMVSLIPGMRHSHPAGWNPPDSYAFAKTMVLEGKPWCVQRNMSLKKGIVEVSFLSSKPLDSAVLVSTVDTGYTGNRKWMETPATLESKGKTWLVKAPLPQGYTGWFINVKSGDLTVSSDFQESNHQ